MSLTRSKNRPRYRFKLMAWGPENVGKSHLLFSAPRVGAVDYENRGGAFDDQFDFASDVPKNIADAERIIAEIAANAEFETIGYDSLSIPYEYYVGHYTTRADGGGESTNYAMVNRHMTNHLSKLVAARDKYVIATVRQTVAYEANGKFLRKAGVKMIGDEVRWPYAFDYVLHFAGRGAIQVQKSMVAHIPNETNIHEDIDFPAFEKLITGEYRLDSKGKFLLPKPTQAAAPKATPAPAPKAEPAPPPTQVDPAPVDLEEATAPASTPPVAAAPDDDEDPFLTLDDAQTRAMHAFVKSRHCDMDDPDDVAFVVDAVVAATGARTLTAAGIPDFKHELIRRTTEAAAAT